MGMQFGASQPTKPKKRRMLGEQLMFDRAMRDAQQKQAEADTGMDPMSKIIRGLVENPDAPAGSYEATRRARADAEGKAAAKRKKDFDRTFHLNTGMSRVQELRRQPGTPEYVMHQIDNDPNLRLSDEDRDLVDSMLTIRRRITRAPQNSVEQIYGTPERGPSPIEPVGTPGTLTNDDVSRILKDLKTPEGRAMMLMERAGFRAQRAQMSSVSHADFAGADFTPEALHDAEARGLTAVRGKRGQVIELKDALDQAGRLGWPTMSFKPQTEDEQAMEMAAPRGNLGQRGIIENGEDISTYLESRFGNSMKAGGDWVHRVVSTIAPAAEQSKGAGIYQMVGGLPAGFVQTIPRSFSNFDYAFDTSKPAYDRVMAGLEGLMNVEFATGVPIIGHLVGHGIAEIASAREVAGLAKDFGVPKDVVAKALHDLRDTRPDGMIEAQARMGESGPSASLGMTGPKGEGVSGGFDTNHGSSTPDLQPGDTVHPLAEFPTSEDVNPMAKGSDVLESYDGNGSGKAKPASAEDVAHLHMDPDHPLLDPFAESRKAKDAQDAVRRALGLGPEDDVRPSLQDFQEAVERRGMSAEQAIEAAKERKAWLPKDTSPYGGFGAKGKGGPIAWRIDPESGNWTPGWRLDARTMTWKKDARYMGKGMSTFSLGGIDDPVLVENLLHYADELDDGSTVYLDYDRSKAAHYGGKTKLRTSKAGLSKAPDGARRLSEMTRREGAEGEYTGSGFAHKNAEVPMFVVRKYAQDLDAILKDAGREAQAEIAGKLGLTLEEWQHAEEYYRTVLRHSGDHTEVASGGADAEFGGRAAGQEPRSTPIAGLGDIRAGFREHFGLDDEQAVAVTRLVEARAKAHARIYGGTPDDYVASRFVDIRSGDAEGLARRAGAETQGNKGAVEFLADGRAVIHALESPDVSTATHELFHVFHRDLDAADLAIVDREHARHLETGGKYTDVREFLARQGERYLRDGSTSNAPLRAVFEKFKVWLSEIYKSLRGSSIESRVSKGMRDVFERMFDEDGRLGNDELRITGDDPLPGSRELTDPLPRKGEGESDGPESLWDVQFQAKERGEDAPLLSKHDGFYLKSEALVHEKMSGPMQATDLRRMLENNGVKPDEMKWTGLDDWLRDRMGTKVAPADVSEFLRDNRVEVREVVKNSEIPTGEMEAKLWEASTRVRLAKDEFRRVSVDVDDGKWDRKTPIAEWMEENHPEILRELRDAEAEQVAAQKVVSENSPKTKYKEYTVPGGENYREVLLTVPTKPKPEAIAGREYYEHFVRKGGEPGWPGLSEARQKEIIDAMPDHARNSYDPDKAYKGPHWDEPNVLAHVRMSDRVIDGKRTLFVDEVQSDWHQAGREKGYRGSESRITNDELRMTNRDGAVPDGPFAKTWHELAMKRVIRMAAEEGYDAIAFTTGDTQALRYSQTFQENIERVKVTKREDGKFDFVARSKRGADVVDDIVDDARLREMLGGAMYKDAKAAMDGGAPDWSASGSDLKIGGHGMREFYDKILPGFLDKYGKKWGAKVGDARLNDELRMTNYGTPVHMMDVTPEMRRSVLEDGQVLFQKGEAPKGAEELEYVLEPPKPIKESRAMRQHKREWFGAATGDVFDQLERVAEPGTAKRQIGRQVAREIDQVLQFRDAHTSRFIGALTKAAKEAYGRGFDLLKGKKAELNKIAELVNEGDVWVDKDGNRLDPSASVGMTDGSDGMAKQTPRDRMTEPQRKVYDKWVAFNTALVQLGQKLGVKVDDVVRLRNGRVLIGERIGFYSKYGESAGMEVEGNIIGVDKGKIFVQKQGGRDGAPKLETLELGTPFTRRPLVDPEYFFPLKVKDEVYDAIARGHGELYDKVVAAARQDIAKKSGIKPEDVPIGDAKSVLEQSSLTQKLKPSDGKPYEEAIKAAKEEIAAQSKRGLEDVAVWEAEDLFNKSTDPKYFRQPTIGVLARIERPRLPVRLPAEFYDNSFMDIAKSHIQSSINRLEAAQVWGHDMSGLTSKIGQLTSDPAESAALLDMVKSALGENHAMTKHDKTFRKAMSVVGAYEVGSKLTGLGTALVQIGATANSFGMLGPKAWTQAMIRAAHPFTGGWKELATIRESGAVSQAVIDLYGMKDTSEVARRVASVLTTVTGVAPIDNALRYHAAIAGRIAVEDALRGLGRQAKGATLPRNANYRLLSDWFHYTDADIVRMMRTGKMTEKDVTTAYHGGAKSQLRSRNADMPKMATTPVFKELFRFQTFNYQQAKFLAHTVSEAKQGNFSPFLRTMAAYAATGVLTVEGKQLLTAWLFKKEPTPPPDNLVERLVSDFTESGVLGMFGRTFDHGWLSDAEDKEGDDKGEVDWSKLSQNMLSSGSKFVDPPALRELSAMAKAIAFARKTQGGLPALADEFLRNSVVLYGRLAKQNDPDYGYIKRMRADAKKKLEDLGVSDASIKNWLDVKFPMPAPRGATDEYRNYKADVAQKATKLRDSEKAKEIIERRTGGRPPKVFAADPERAPVKRGRTKMGANMLDRMIMKRAGAGK